MRHAVLLILLFSVLVITVSAVGLAEAKPGFLSIHLRVLDTSSDGIEGARCTVIGISSDGPVSISGTVFTNHRGSVHVDVVDKDSNSNLFTELQVVCDTPGNIPIGSTSVPVKAHGPHKIIVVEGTFG